MRGRPFRSNEAQAEHLSALPVKNLFATVGASLASRHRQTINPDPGCRTSARFDTGRSMVRSSDRRRSTYRTSEGTMKRESMTISTENLAR